MGGKERCDKDTIFNDQKSDHLTDGLLPADHKEETDEDYREGIDHLEVQVCTVKASDVGNGEVGENHQTAADQNQQRDIEIKVFFYLVFHGSIGSVKQAGNVDYFEQHDDHTYDQDIEAPFPKQAAYPHDTSGEGDQCGLNTEGFDVGFDPLMRYQ